MGGFGSGRQEYATTPTVEECRHLSIDKFTDVVDRPGRGGPIYWGDPDDPDASISVVLLSADHLTALKNGEKLETIPAEDADPADAPAADRVAGVYLHYTTTDRTTGESRDISYHVRLEYTTPNFGGVRPWFRCPSHAGGCTRRVGKLYQPLYTDQARFLCRECYDLGYRSSRTSGNKLERAEQRYRKAFSKADAENRRPHPNDTPHTPERPKGIHQDTFDDLLTDVQNARVEWDDRMGERMGDLLAQYDTGAVHAAGAEHAAGAFGYTDR